MLEYWNIANKSKKILFKLSKNPSNTSFHNPIIPLFQLGLPAPALQWQAGRSPWVQG